MLASNHWRVGELLPPVGPLHGLGRSENGLQEVLVDLKWTEERRRLVQCLAGLICTTATGGTCHGEAQKC